MFGIPRNVSCADAGNAIVARLDRLDHVFFVNETTSLQRFIRNVSHVHMPHMNRAESNAPPTAAMYSLARKHNQCAQRVYAQLYARYGGRSLA